MPDYLPASDTEFTSWMKRFITVATANQATLGLTAGQLAAVQAQATVWEQALATHFTAKAQAKASTQAKYRERGTLTGLVRPLVTMIQALPDVKDSQRHTLGMTVSSTARAAVAVPTSRPLAVVIDTSTRLRHTITFVDDAGTVRRAKPRGVIGCEIWIKIGETSPTTGELRYLATATRSPYVAEFDGADGGQTAFYMLRWVNTRGERGPWSQTFGATITN
jgi:hypothetical protein